MKELTGTLLPIVQISEPMIDELYQLFVQFYDGGNKEIFHRDLMEKEWIILLTDGEKVIRGFSTLIGYKSVFEGAELGVIYSGDTLIHPDYWGSTVLQRLWIQSALQIAEQLPKPVYWLLISAGYKTYRFLPVFYRRFYPHYEETTPNEMRRLIDQLAQERFGEQYDRENGVVRFTQGATPLKEGVAEISEKRLRDPHIAHFLRLNPGHVMGEELVCLTEITIENLTRAGLKMIKE